MSQTLRGCPTKTVANDWHGICPAAEQNLAGCVDQPLRRAPDNLDADKIEAHFELPGFAAAVQQERKIDVTAAWMPGQSSPECQGRFEGRTRCGPFRAACVDDRPVFASALSDMVLAFTTSAPASTAVISSIAYKVLTFTQGDGHRSKERPGGRF